jgi:phosphocarrier protein
MTERRVRVVSKVGLHARPAALFVQAATQAPVDVTVAKPGTDPVDAKSILSVLALDAQCGDEIVITADGDGSEELLEDLAAVVSTPEAPAK